jgi:RHS repeat-associated protein
VRVIDETSQFQGSGPSGSAFQVPSLELPKGGGALRGLDEQYAVNPANGTLSLSIPLPVASARGFVPGLSLGYDSGGGNGVAGLGWDIRPPAVTRRTDKQLPQYKDAENSDTFSLSGNDDLVPFLELTGGNWAPKTADRTLSDGTSYHIRYYRPRSEGIFSRIEWWQNTATGHTHWRVIGSANVTSIYGRSDQACIADPTDDTRVFSWLLERVYDDKGHLIEYEYKPEDGAGDHGRRQPYTNTYLKTIRYGNATTFLPHRETQGGYTGGFLFETVLDYGEYDHLTPWLGEVRPWPQRPDATTNYRAGFPIRLARRCERVLLFHRIPDVNGVAGYDGLVSSLNLSYLTDNSGGRSLLSEVFSRGFQRHNDGNYTSKDIPPVTFLYEEHAWDNTIRQVAPDSLDALPNGLADPKVTLVDLRGEALPGVLIADGPTLYYKENLGNATFGKAQKLAEQPSYVATAAHPLQITDLLGNGEKQFIHLSSRAAGYFTRHEDGPTEGFHPFTHQPNIDFTDPSLRLIDLTGDGSPDIFFTDDRASFWHPSMGKEGYSAARKSPTPLDKDGSPALAFHEDDAAIYLADMTGDGLTDLLRIRNGSAIYWPNLGYGKFGKPVRMIDAPVFGSREEFDPRRIRLSDIDGSGPADLLYVGDQSVTCWANLSGEAWSPTSRNFKLPGLSEHSDVRVVDLLGQGTACIVWSSPRKQGARPQVQYLDLMAGKKPLLINGHRNNMGMEVSFEFTPSTVFYLADKRAGTPWLTNLPFPVHSVSRTISRDLVQGTVFTNTSTYHHGYYDTRDREFRGFGRVETFSTEDFETFSRLDGANVLSEEHHQPPRRSVRWFHNGAGLLPEEGYMRYAGEYFSSPLNPESRLPTPHLPPGLKLHEQLQAVRAFKGTALRGETYTDDGTDLAKIPFSSAQSRLEIRLIQPARGEQPAVFQLYGGEAIDINYDRRVEDPHVSQSMTLRTDDLGQADITATVIYPRRNRPMGQDAIPDPVWAEQSVGHIAVIQQAFTNDVDLEDDYRLRFICESRGFEVLGIPVTYGNLFTAADLMTIFLGGTEIEFAADASPGVTENRLASHSRRYFLAADLMTQLPFGTIDALGIGYRTMGLTYTPALVTKLYGNRVTPAMLTAAGYITSEGDANYWTPTGTAVYQPGAEDRFYLPSSSADAFGVGTTVEQDAFNLTALRVTDPAGMSVSVEVDYRTLQALTVTDANGNRGTSLVDEIGVVVASASMGKLGSADGDTLADPTSRVEYDMFNWLVNGRPNFSHTFTREEHGPGNTRFLETFTYSSGSGGILMIKSAAPNGPALRWNDVTNSLETVGDANSPRWIGNGRTVFNNAGLPIKSYEPYFSTTPDFENEPALVNIGESPIRYYDAVGRNYLTHDPDGTITRTEFSPWKTTIFDAGDTVLDSDWYISRNSPDPLAPEPNDPEERAAWLSANYHGTPMVMHATVMGGMRLTTSDLGNGVTTSVRSESDPLGRYNRLFDQGDRLIGHALTAMDGSTAYGATAERGERWIFTDVIGRPVRSWDGTQREYFTEFDAFHRPISSHVLENGMTTTVTVSVYGDSLPHSQARALNALGKVIRVFDGAGAIEFAGFDFKGVPATIRRQLTLDHTTNPDWSPLLGLTGPELMASVPVTGGTPLLSSEVFTATATYDATGRPVTSTLPDGTVIRPIYDAGGGLGRLEARIQGGGPFRVFMEDQEYDARGQRQSVRYGNNTICRYFYDPLSFQLRNLLTFRAGDDPATEALQDLHFTYDAVGNLVEQSDEAQQVNYFSNAVVTARRRYAYDAGYRLVLATGREGASRVPAQPTPSDIPAFNAVPHVNNATAVRRYTQTYEYDDFGNITQMRHVTPSGLGNWTRRYQYAQELDPTNTTNRLVATSRAGDAAGVFSDNAYAYDGHGNMTQMPHLAGLDWDHGDRLTHVDLGGGGDAYYNYGAGGGRMRKTIERNDGILRERIYLGQLEVYRERRPNATPHLERWTLHIGDNTGRIARVDTKAIDTNQSDPGNALNVPLIRYQYGDLNGSSVLEADDTGQVVYYEEFHPYGTSAYRMGRAANDLSLKRYRFAGKERDDETGLDHMGARFYAPWLGRWTSSDPAGFVDGFNVFRYCRCNPTNFTDPSGLDPDEISRTLPTTNGPAGAAATQNDPASGEIWAAWARQQRVTIDGEVNTISGGRPVFKNGRWNLTGVTFNPVGEAGEGEGSGGGEQAPTDSADPAGPAADAPPTPPPEETPAEGDETSVPNPVESARTVIIGSNQPQLTTGGPAPGNLHLYSGPSGTAAAQAAGATGNDYWLRQTPHYERAVAAEAALTRANGGVAPDYMTQSRPQVWDPASRALAREATLGGRGVESNGLGTYEQETPYKASSTTQALEEIRMVRNWGALTAGLGAISGIVTIWAGSNYNNPVMQGVAYVSGGGELAGAGYYAYGVYRITQWAPGSAAIMARGALAMRVFGGVGMIVMSTYNFTRNLESGNYGVLVGDAAGYVAGFGILAGSAPVTAIAGSVGVISYGSDWIEREVTGASGSRALGVGAGTAAGATVGAGAGAAIGVWFFGVGAAPGAIVGGLVGGAVGFIGSYW